MVIKTIPNFIRNTDKIISLVKRHENLFQPRAGKDTHASIIPGICSKFKTLKSENMRAELIAAIFEDCDFDPDLKDFYSFIQIQKYEPGDFIAPHRDSYDIQKLHLITLTSSEVDGLVCEDMNGGLVKIFDVAGQYIDFPYNAIHYVSPVKYDRYSMVVAE
jgi:hypothetical protein